MKQQLIYLDADERAQWFGIFSQIDKGNYIGNERGAAQGYLRCVNVRFGTDDSAVIGALLARCIKLEKRVIGYEALIEELMR